MVAAINEAGNVYGRLEVIRRTVAPVDQIMHASHRTRAWWDCQCECGRVVAVKSVDLRTGVRKSCGCGRSETIRATRGSKLDVNA